MDNFRIFFGAFYTGGVLSSFVPSSNSAFDVDPETHVGLLDEKAQP